MLAVMKYDGFSIKVEKTYMFNQIYPEQNQIMFTLNNNIGRVFYLMNKFKEFEDFALSPYSNLFTDHRGVLFRQFRIDFNTGLAKHLKVYDTSILASSSPPTSY